MRRRGFLIATLGVVGAGTLACGGAATLSLRPPVTEFAEPSCATTGGTRVLVAYASKCGATAEIAAAVGTRLCAAGLAVDVRSVDAVADVGPYSAVVLGSAARMGRLLPAAVRFAERHGNSLANLPVAYYFSGTTMNQDTAEHRDEALTYLAPLRSVREPVDQGLFGGKVSRGTLEPLWRVALTFVNDGDMAEGDHRDWNAIDAWAAALPPLLAA
ncbi:MAG: flavodoxin domain-containing protein [Anaerolineae bacterium]